MNRLIQLNFLFYKKKYPHHWPKKKPRKKLAEAYNYYWPKNAAKSEFGSNASCQWLLNDLFKYYWKYAIHSIIETFDDWLSVCLLHITRKSMFSVQTEGNLLNSPHEWSNAYGKKNYFINWNNIQWLRITMTTCQEPGPSRLVDIWNYQNPIDLVLSIKFNREHEAWRLFASTNKQHISTWFRHIWHSMSLNWCVISLTLPLHYVLEVDFLLLLPGFMQWFQFLVNRLSLLLDMNTFYNWMDLHMALSFEFSSSF